MMKNYEGVLKIEGDVGNKEKYDPRSYMKLAEAAMAERVKQAVNDLKSVGTTLFGIGR
jgi:fructose-bisphosphate aldolase class II